jgi:hypothetical protein
LYKDAIAYVIAGKLEGDLTRIKTMIEHGKE